YGGEMVSTGHYQRPPGRAGLTGRGDSDTGSIPVASIY
ncbi:hypothetical protein LCGC14_1737000, partial [marine sediment metagenome]